MNDCVLYEKWFWTLKFIKNHVQYITLYALETTLNFIRTFKYILSLRGYALKMYKTIPHLITWNLNQKVLIKNNRLKKYLYNKQQKIQMSTC